LPRILQQDAKLDFTENSQIRRPTFPQGKSHGAKTGSRGGLFPLSGLVVDARDERGGAAGREERIITITLAISNLTDSQFPADENWELSIENWSDSGAIFPLSLRIRRCRRRAQRTGFVSAGSRLRSLRYTSGCARMYPAPLKFVHRNKDI
jgi:hypothetical protein